MNLGLDNLTLEMIIIIIVIIIIPIVIWLIARWIKKIKEAKKETELQGSGISKDDLPKHAPKNKKEKPYTLAPDKAIEISGEINDSIHTFSSDDTVNMLSILKANVKTRTDMAMVIQNLLIAHNVKLYDVLKKDLNSEQTKIFSSWLKSLPEYV